MCFWYNQDHDKCIIQYFKSKPLEGPRNHIRRDSPKKFWSIGILVRIFSGDKDDFKRQATMMEKKFAAEREAAEARIQQIRQGISQIHARSENERLMHQDQYKSRHSIKMITVWVCSIKVFIFEIDLYISDVNDFSTILMRLRWRIRMLSKSLKILIRYILIHFKYEMLDQFRHYFASEILCYIEFVYILVVEIGSFR